jgi:hypothetical protein
MEYYRFHHSDTLLPTRFPIGLEKLVKGFNAGDFKAFYDAHYYPANMCLYIAGDVDVADMESKIQRVFGAQVCHESCLLCHADMESKIQRVFGAQVLVPQVLVPIPYSRHDMCHVFYVMSHVAYIFSYVNSWHDVFAKRQKKV